MPPRISVVMPVYNARLFLTEAIDSITEQTFHDFEFIIVDDGSTDGSFQLSQAAAARDSRIRLIRQSHAGVTAALNRGLAAARGDFVARMDADDISLPERFEIQTDALDRQPDVLAVGSFVQRIDADGDAIAVAKWPLTHEEIAAGLLRGRGGLAHPTAMIRSSALRAVRGYRQKFAFAQDKDLWLRLAERGRLQNLPLALVRYREHPQCVSAARQAEQWKAVCEAVRDACQRRSAPIPREIRETATAKSRTDFDQCRDWVRAAARAGNLTVAWKHTRHLLRERPLATQTWAATLRLITAFPALRIAQTE